MDATKTPPAHWSYGEKPALAGADAAPKAGKAAAEGVQSVRRAVTVLNVLGSFGRTGASVAKISQLSQLHKATAHRILGALLGEGLVEQDPSSRNYRLGARISVLNALMGQQFDLRIVGQQVLDRLAEATGDAIYLGVRTHFDGLCLDLREGEHKVPVLRLRPNECWPLGIGAFSIALIAFLPDEEVDAIIEHNARYLGAQRDITPSYIRQQVDSTRACGHAASRNLGNLGMAAVAVPVFDPLWRPIASLCITTTLERLSAEREKELVNLLWAESRAITTNWCELGGFSRPITWRKGLASSI
ncbi:IclR family transcriptional regulator [Aquincola sp. S2]|uniref:IclR family transcriptional regulator n=1 Tax=Pseudaquabacterium terrae TaxID=2732868 RepID=A0ABX2EUF7_9BURK|nr:IclR family transcriptional regulator [Aquabacterium terrae]NRF72375.1 IclR family transcriptional regulator [Aquabacterium terrae]